MTGIGVAGWAYADWEGPVYPAAKGRAFHPLTYLSQYVDCMEVNASFYALPRPEHAARWVERVAGNPSFRFIVKLHRSFTHDAPSPTWDADAARFRDAISPIAEADRLLGLLVQFPVGFRAGRANAEQVLQIRRAFPDLCLCLELRHASWFAPAWYQAFEREALGLVHIDLPASERHPPAEHPVIGPLAYLRLHGRNAATWFDPKAGRDDRYDFLYSPEELEGVARRLNRIASEAERSVVITNNHFGGQAVANALELKHLLSGERPPAPEPLRLAFPHLASVTRPDGQQLLF